MELKDIIKKPIVVTPETTFKEAVRLMMEEKTNVLLVADTDGKLAGMISVTDLLEAIVPDYLDDDSISAHFVSEEMFGEVVTSNAEKPVREFMSTKVSKVEANESLMSVAVTALHNKKLRIPVVDENDRPIGVISRQGLKGILANQLGISTTDTK